MQRAGELAVINEIGEALAKKLDFQAVIEAVGDRIRTIFASDSFGIRLWDPTIEPALHAVRVRSGRTLSSLRRTSSKRGLAKIVITERRSLRLGTAEDSTRSER